MREMKAALEELTQLMPGDGVVARDNWTHSTSATSVAELPGTAVIPSSSIQRMRRTVAEANKAGEALGKPSVTEASAAMRAVWSEAKNTEQDGHRRLVRERIIAFIEQRIPRGTVRT